MTEPQAPDGYVQFVARHLASLRAESDRLTGERGQGEEIYPEALADVAARWRWLERCRPGVADAYLRRTLATRARRWREEQPYPVEVYAVRAEPLVPASRRRRVASLGQRQAAFLAPEAHAPLPVAEAAIAWWHAYEAQRRRRRVALVVGLFLAFTALANVATIY